MSEVLAGQVLLIADAGALVPLRVMHLDEGRVVAQGLSGEERSLAMKRVFWLSPKVVDSQEALASYWTSLQDRSDALSLDEAWSKLEAEEKGEAVGDERLLELLRVPATTENRDALALSVFGNSLYFKLRQRQILVSDEENVTAALEKAAEKQRQAEAFEEARSWLITKLNGHDVPPMSAAVIDHIDAIKSVALFGRTASTSRVGISLIDDVLGDDTRDATERAFELLCTLEIFAPNENLIPHRAGLTREFPEEVLQQLEGDLSRVSLEGRRDMTHLTTLSIDDEHTDEIDDAFALEGNRLHVFIADVSHYVPIGSAFDEEASTRLSTVYIPEGKLPMLPAAIGQDLASLNHGETRPALCFSGTIDAHGAFSDVEISEVLCSVDHRLDYTTVDSWLATGDGSGELMPVLRTMESWSEAHLERRKDAGAMVFQRNELYPHVDEFGRVGLHQPDANGPSRLLIAEMMVAICCQAARFMRDNQVPAIYRGQQPPDREIDLSLLDLGDPSVEYELLRNIKPSALSLHPKPHAALGASCYAQVSSPIRRYADLLMHRQLKARLRSEPLPYTVDDLGEILGDIEQRQGIIRRVERESNRYWLLRYLEQTPGLELDAVVLRRLKKRYLVNLPALCMPATILSRGRLATGQVLRMRVSEVDARNDLLVLNEA